MEVLEIFKLAGSLVLGVVGGLFSPWLKYTFERRKARDTNERERITQWWEMSVGIHAHKNPTPNPFAFPGFAQLFDKMSTGDQTEIRRIVDSAGDANVRYSNDWDRVEDEILSGRDPNQGYPTKVIERAKHLLNARKEVLDRDHKRVLTVIVDREIARIERQWNVVRVIKSKT